MYCNSMNDKTVSNDNITIWTLTRGIIRYRGKSYRWCAVHRVSLWCAVSYRITVQKCQCYGGRMHLGSNLSLLMFFCLRQHSAPGWFMFSCCLWVCLCILNFLWTLSWKVLGIFSRNFCRGCVLGQRWMLRSLGSKSQRSGRGRSMTGAQQAEAYRAWCCVLSSIF